MKRIKVAIFGTGFMGRVHTEALRRLGNIEVTSIAGGSKEGASRLLTKFQSSVQQAIIANF